VGLAGTRSVQTDLSISDVKSTKIHFLPTTKLLPKGRDLTFQCKILVKIHVIQTLIKGAGHKINPNRLNASLTISKYLQHWMRGFM
jgi:hypothetical protein